MSIFGVHAFLQKGYLLFCGYSCLIHILTFYLLRVMLLRPILVLCMCNLLLLDASRCCTALMTNTPYPLSQGWAQVCFLVPQGMLIWVYLTWSSCEPLWEFLWHWNFCSWGMFILNVTKHIRLPSGSSTPIPRPLGVHIPTNSWHYPAH